MIRMSSSAFCKAVNAGTVLLFHSWSARASKSQWADAMAARDAGFASLGCRFGRGMLQTKHAFRMPEFREAQLAQVQLAVLGGCCGGYDCCSRCGYCAGLRGGDAAAVAGWAFGGSSSRGGVAVGGALLPLVLSSPSPRSISSRVPLTRTTRPPFWSAPRPPCAPPLWPTSSLFPRPSSSLCCARWGRLAVVPPPVAGEALARGSCCEEVEKGSTQSASYSSASS